MVVSHKPQISRLKRFPVDKQLKNEGNMKTQIDYRKLLELFVAKDYWRSILLRPFKQQEYYLASDSHSVVWFKAKEDLGYSAVKEPNMFKHIPSKRPLKIRISVEKIEKGLIPWMIKETELIECDECEGKGECPVCLGLGERHSYVEVIDQCKPYKIHGADFSYKNIDRLIKAAKLVGAEYITKTAGGERTANVFDIGQGVNVLLMPVVGFDNVPVIM